MIENVVCVHTCMGEWEEVDGFYVHWCCVYKWSVVCYHILNVWQYSLSVPRLFV